MLVCQKNRDDNIKNNALYTEIQEKKLLLKQMQPPSFRGEGDDVEKKAEVCIEAMDDYFIEAKTTTANQSMLGMFQLTGDAKLWWKQHCCDIGVAEDSQSWREIKQAVKEMYLPRAHEALKMNEFFALKQRGLSLKEYYSKFVSLRRYAPVMIIEQLVARFCQGLNEPIGSRLESMKPTTVQDALLQTKPLIKERGVIGQRRRFEPNQSSNGLRQ
ncbi:hypothetical protein L7F22_067050 [Adiantum nelumboides]|nr:hypothetical protein [Adiantum nelumboides]